MAHVYIALGSNKGDRKAMLLQALGCLTRAVTIEAVSAFHETKPVGEIDQPDFLNAVCRCSTDLSPVDLLRLIKGIEHDLGRTPSQRWGPREIDLDILLYDGIVYRSAVLEIPHPRMWERDFVIIPLAEVLG